MQTCLYISTMPSGECIVVVACMLRNDCVLRSAKCVYGNFCIMQIERVFKKAYSYFFFGFFSKSLRFWYHKNRHIFLIIILKFHVLIPLRLEGKLQKLTDFIDLVVTTGK